MAEKWFKAELNGEAIVCYPSEIQAQMANDWRGEVVPVHVLTDDQWERLIELAIAIDHEYASCSQMKLGASMLTDEQCDEFRARRGTFNDMVRAIYEAARKNERERLANYLKAFGHVQQTINVNELAAFILAMEDV